VRGNFLNFIFIEAKVAALVFNGNDFCLYRRTKHFYNDGTHQAHPLSSAYRHAEALPVEGESGYLCFYKYKSSMGGGRGFNVVF